MALITVGVTALRVHCWQIEAADLRIDERPRFAFAGFVNSAFAPWADIVALRRIESGLVRQLEIELHGCKVHRMSQALLQDELGRRIIPDHAGLDALAAAISARLAAAGVAAAQAQEALSFWNRLPGLALLGVMFVASLAIAGAGLAAMAGGQLLRRRNERRRVHFFVALGRGLCDLQIGQASPARAQGAVRCQRLVSLRCGIENIKNA